MVPSGWTPDPFEGSDIEATLSSADLASPADKRARTDPHLTALTVVVGEKPEHVTPSNRRTSRADTTFSSSASSVEVAEARLRLSEAEHAYSLAEHRACVDIHRQRFNVEVLRHSGSRSRSTLGSEKGDGDSVVDTQHSSVSRTLRSHVGDSIHERSRPTGVVLAGSSSSSTSRPPLASAFVASPTLLLQGGAGQPARQTVSSTAAGQLARDEAQRS
jgi:hypothetical protein